MGNERAIVVFTEKLAVQAWPWPYCIVWPILLVQFVVSRFAASGSIISGITEVCGLWLGLRVSDEISMRELAQDLAATYLCSLLQRGETS